MTLLQFFLIFISIVFLLFAIDAFQRKRLNLLHFLVFFWWLTVILLFSFNPDLLNSFWQFFWVARWADLLVYIGIVLLAYFYFELLHKVTRNRYELTKFITHDSIEKTKHKYLEDVYNKLSKFSNENKNNNYIFLLRAYNEEQKVWEVIDEIIDNWYNKIIVVNDWSSDKTKEVIEEKYQLYPKKIIIPINHKTNRWWWAANKTWFEFLKNYWNQLNINYVVTYDADWQMCVDDMKVFKKEINKDDHLDILIGSRFAKWWKAENIPFSRKIILFWSRLVTYFINWLWVTDPHNGYRVIKLDSLKKININSDWMSYASEILDEIKRLKLNFKEIPVNIKYTEYSVSKWQKNSNAIKILLELIYKKFFFK